MGEREILVQDITAYLRSFNVPEEKVPTALKVIEQAATFDSHMPIDREVQKTFPNYLGQIPDEKNFYYTVPRSFSPQHYSAIVGFIQRFEVVLTAEWEKQMQEDERISRHLDSQRYWMQARDDFELEDLQPDGEIIVEPERIVVRAFVKGLGNRLSKKNRKHLGFGNSLGYGECCSEWEFPLSELEAVKQSGLPVLLYPAKEEVNVLE
jgi:hypothetical protein